jgi:phosphoglycolate phosphatase-like HAD superfamily hydrolase
MMSGKKLLIIDVDDVLLDWTASFGDFITENYGYDGVPLGENPKRLWDILNVPKEQVIEIMKEHNNSSYFKKLKYFNDSKVFNQPHDFDKVVCVTACGIELQVQLARMNNLEDLFPGFINEITCLPYYSEKFDEFTKIIEAHRSYDIFLLDDNVADVKFALKNGVNAFVYKSAFYDNENLRTVDNSTDFLSAISGN